MRDAGSPQLVSRERIEWRELLDTLDEGIEHLAAFRNGSAACRAIRLREAQDIQSDSLKTACPFG
jgi:hypothetical protein